eukprot:GCRY01003352.1.p1 GENE.GCRY01003352.1~~GCRY01003352.1.p1  ORF type:complete len:293 (+),score=65.25 GCRY01003352.1:192-1070(+)
MDSSKKCYCEEIESQSQEICLYATDISISPKVFLRKCDDCHQYFCEHLIFHRKDLNKVFSSNKKWKCYACKSLKNAPMHVKIPLLIGAASVGAGATLAAAAGIVTTGACVSALGYSAASTPIFCSGLGLLVTGSYMGSTVGVAAGAGFGLSQAALSTSTPADPSGVSEEMNTQVSLPINSFHACEFCQSATAALQRITGTQQEFTKPVKSETLHAVTHQCASCNKTFCSHLVDLLKPKFRHFTGKKDWRCANCRGPVNSLTYGTPELQTETFKGKICCRSCTAALLYEDSHL